MATLQPTEFEICAPNGGTLVVRKNDGGVGWIAVVSSDAIAPTPEIAADAAARKLRELADVINPLTDAITTMMRGLVRAAELKEKDEDGKIWDDACRRALEMARGLGWGNGQVGTLGR